MSVFEHGQLRLFLLGLLDQGPRHGYDIMRDLEQRFSGLYSPSAGTVYPRLAKLEEEGLVERTDEGRKASYRLTDAGRAEARARAEDIAAVESSIEESAARLADEMRQRVRRQAADLRSEIDAETSRLRSGAGADRSESARAQEAPRDEAPAGAEGARRDAPFPFADVADLDRLVTGLVRGVTIDGESLSASVRRVFDRYGPPRTDGVSPEDTADVIREAEAAVRHAEAERTSGSASAHPCTETSPLVAQTGSPDDIAEEEADRARSTASTSGTGAAEETPRTADMPGTGMPDAEQMREVVAILQDAGRRIQDVLRRPR